MGTTSRVSRGRVPCRLDGTRLALGLLGLLGIAGAELAACGSPATPLTPTHQGTALYFVLDGNFFAAKSNSDLRFSVVALSSHDGHMVWQHRLETPAPADSTYANVRPLYQDGLVYVTYVYTDQQTQTQHGVVEALDPATGATHWRQEVATEIGSEPVVSGSLVYIAATVVSTLGPASGLVEALDSQTGTVRWQKALNSAPSAPAIANGQVFVMTSEQFGGQLLALRASDGSVLWNYLSDSPVSIGDDTENGGSTAPLVRNGLVYAQATVRNASGEADRELVALNTRDGSVAWHYLPEGGTATPAFNQSGDTLCVSSSTSSPAGNSSIVVGLAATSGKVRWRASGAGFLSGCSSSGEAFYLTEGSASQPGSILALNSQNGQQLWRVPTASPIVADGLLAPTVTNGFLGVYLTGHATASIPVMGRIAVLRASDGKLVWQHDFSGRPDLLMDIEGDQIYNPEMTGDMPIIVVYALNSGSRLWSYQIGHL